MADRARLGELPGDAAHLDHRHAGGVGQHHRHLQDDLELVPDGVGGELGEGLGAVAGLEQEGVAVGHVGQLRGEVARLAGEDERRQGGQPRLGLLEGVRVGPLRLLRRGELPPGRGCPRGEVGRGSSPHQVNAVGSPLMAAFRFALQASHAASPAAWRDLARKTEDLGYSTLYVPDHLDDQWAPMVALTVAAEATTTLRVGTLVLDNDFRHPVVLAKEAATLDVVTGGRFEFGLGAGWMTTDYEQSGIPMDPPSVRVARLAESLEIMRAMWRTGSATFSGEHYRVARTRSRHRRP